MKKKYVYCTIVYLSLLFISNSLYAQKEGYYYKFYPKIENSYYYTLSYSKNTSIGRNQMLLSIKVLDRKGYPVDVSFGHLCLVTENKDTIRLKMMGTNVLEKKIPRQSFSFDAYIENCRLENRNVFIDDCRNKYNKISLTIILGTRSLPPIHIIHSERELTSEELEDICNDYVFGTKKSKLIEGKDYSIGVEI